MSERRDIIVGRQGCGNPPRQYYVKIGTAWFNDNGSVSLRFDALPIDGDAFIPVADRDRDGGNRSSGSRSGYQRGGSRSGYQRGQQRQQQQRRQDRQEELPMSHPDDELPDDDVPDDGGEDDIPF